MYNPDLDYRAISREVEHKLARKKRRLQIEGLAGHIIMFVLVFSVALFGHWLDDTALLFFMAWLVGLLLHVGTTFVSLGRRDTKLREQLLQQAIQDAIVRLGHDSTPQKYTNTIRLSEDGELIHFDEEYIEKPKRAEL